MFGREILALPVFFQAIQSTRPWVGSVATVAYEFLRAEPGPLFSALNRTP